MRTNDHEAPMCWRIKFMHLITWLLRKRKNLKMCEKRHFLLVFVFFPHRHLFNFYQEGHNLFFCHKGSKENSKTKVVYYRFPELDRVNQCQKWQEKILRQYSLSELIFGALKWENLLRAIKERMRGRVTQKVEEITVLIWIFLLKVNNQSATGKHRANKSNFSSLLSVNLSYWIFHCLYPSLVTYWHSCALF